MVQTISFSFVTLGTPAEFESNFDQGDVRLTYTSDSSSHAPRGTGYEDKTIDSLSEVPDEVSAEWWREYGHNFEVRGNTVRLKRRFST